MTHVGFEGTLDVSVYLLDRWKCEGREDGLRSAERQADHIRHGFYSPEVLAGPGKSLPDWRHSHDAEVGRFHRLANESVRKTSQPYCCTESPKRRCFPGLGVDRNLSVEMAQMAVSAH